MRRLWRWTRNALLTLIALVLGLAFIGSQAPDDGAGTPSNPTIVINQATRIRLTHTAHAKTRVAQVPTDTPVPPSATWVPTKTFTLAAGSRDSARATATSLHFTLTAQQATADAASPTTAPIVTATFTPTAIPSATPNRDSTTVALVWAAQTRVAARTQTSVAQTLPASTPDEVATLEQGIANLQATIDARITVAPEPVATDQPTNTPELTNTDQPTQTPRPTMTDVPEPLLYYAHSDVNVRGGTSTAYGVVDILRRGDEIAVLNEVDGDAVNGNRIWYEIEINGRTAYVHSSTVQDYAPSVIVNPTAAPPVAPAGNVEAPPVNSLGGENTSGGGEGALVDQVAPQAQPTQPPPVPAQPTAVPPPPVQPTQPPPPPPPTVPPQPIQPTQPPAPAFTCDCSKTCPQMLSCEEAYFQLNTCGCGRRDGDNDGVPCEIICPGG